MTKKIIKGRPRRPGTFTRVHFELPENVYMALKKSAEGNMRNITSEITVALKTYYNIK